MDVTMQVVNEALYDICRRNLDIECTIMSRRCPGTGRTSESKNVCARMTTESHTAHVTPSSDAVL